MKKLRTRLGALSPQPVSALNFLEVFSLTAAALGSAGTFTSDVITLGSSMGYSKWRALVSSDQAGTLNMQQSPDGITFYTTLSQAYAAGGQAAVVESLVAMPYLRLSYVNGSAAQGSFLLAATLVAV